MPKTMLGAALLLIAVWPCPQWRQAWGQASGQAAPPFAVVSGRNAVDGMQYVLISVNGRLVTPPSVPEPPSPWAAPPPAEASAAPAPPRFTAQCTKDPSGKLNFEMLADFGGVPAVDYYPPWRWTPQMQAKPTVHTVMVLTEFLGYTRIKPMRFGWNYVREMPGEMHYATPGFHSANMESERVFMQYLRSLPTLRMTILTRGVVEFDTSKWQAAVKAEPMCWASGL